MEGSDGEIRVLHRNMLYPCPYLAVTTDREKSEKTKRQQRNRKEPRQKVDQKNEESDEELDIEAITIETTKERQNADELRDETLDIKETDEIERTVKEPVTQVAEEVLQQNEERLSLGEESASLDSEEVPEGRPQRNRRAPPVFTFSSLGGNPYYRVQAIAQTQPPVFQAQVPRFASQGQLILAYIPTTPIQQGVFLPRFVTQPIYPNTFPNTYAARPIGQCFQTTYRLPCVVR